MQVPTPDHVIGNYRVTRKLGEGGMGAVYAGEHAILGRRAAVKVLRAELSHDRDLVSRFFNEARAASAVKHPGIVEIYDFGYAADGSAFIVMECLEGESLAARLRRLGVIEEARAASMARQIARALAAAHAKGIVHRDLKPDNVFVVADPDTADGERTKILDFGIAKLTGEDHVASTVTSTGMVMGTPTYMSPEQCKGAGLVDHRTDLYALGCILFEMICGRPPFLAVGAGELMAQHIFAPPPPPSSLRPVSPALEQVIVRALAKEPDHRYASADELIAALDAATPTGAHARASAAQATVIAPGATTGGVRVATTLSSAAGTAALPAPPRARVGVIAAAIGGAAVAGAIAFVAVRGATATPAGPAAPPPRAPVIAPAPHPAPPPPAPPAPPTTITLAVRSDPAGADVFRASDGMRIGTTPFDYAMPASDGDLVLIVKKAGFDDGRVAVRADRDRTIDLPLARTPVEHVAPKPPRHPHASGSGAGSGTGAPRPVDGSLDPFDHVGAGP